MAIDAFHQFLVPFCGGLIISIASSFHLLTKGRVTGMSGIFHGIILWEKDSLSWRITLVCSMVITAALAWLVQVYGISTWSLFDSPETVVSDLNLGGFLLAGFCVGFGTKLANGCTSGHGVCGLPRLSIRSWVATPVFVAVGIGIASIRAHEPFLTGFEATDIVLNINMTTSYSVFLVLSTIIIIGIIIKEYRNAYAHEVDIAVAKKVFKKQGRDVFISMIVGSLFALGLLIGGMCKRSRIINFLAITNDWDISLLFVLLGAVMGNFPLFYYIINIRKKPICDEKFSLANNTVIDWKLVGGSVLFGFGWGIGGLCPGPGFTLFPMVTPQITLLWFPGLAIGQICAKYLEKYARNPMKIASQKTMH